MLQAHNWGVFQVVSNDQVLVTRDKEGVMMMWDTDLITDHHQDQDQDPDNSALIRKLDLPHRKQFLSVHINQRMIAIGKVGGIELLDFWNTLL